jgi:hypothetical protein
MASPPPSIFHVQFFFVAPERERERKRGREGKKSAVCKRARLIGMNRCCGQRRKIVQRNNAMSFDAAVNAAGKSTFFFMLDDIVKSYFQATPYQKGLSIPVAKQHSY